MSKIEDIIQESIKIGLDEYEQRHPATWAAIEKRIVDVESLIMATLEKDAAYLELLSRSDVEINAAAIVKVTVDAALSLLEKFLLN